MAAAPPIRLLLVNDEPATAEAIAIPIQRLNRRYRVHNAASRGRFFQNLWRQRPDVILVGEQGVPGLPLEELFEALRNCNSEIPVVVLGGGLPDHLGSLALRLGAFDYLRMDQVECLTSIIEEALLRRPLSSRASKHAQEKSQRVAELMREEQKLVTIGRLTASIAHEINNPLESITNLLYLLEGEPGLTETARGYLALAQRELGRVVQISKETLNFSREAPAPTRIQISKLVEEVLVLYATRIAQKHIKLTRQFDDEIPVVVFPGEMRQVLSNLISNAIEASSDGGKLSLRIRKSRLWADAGVTGLRLTVADNGAGIPAEIRHRIGEAFFTTKGQSGTGLGLWVTKSILKRYGGSLLLHSSTGRFHGTAFSIFLPTNLRPQPVANPSHGPPFRGDTDFKIDVKDTA